MTPRPHPAPRTRAPPTPQTRPHGIRAHARRSPRAAPSTRVGRARPRARRRDSLGRPPQGCVIQERYPVVSALSDSSAREQAVIQRARM